MATMNERAAMAVLVSAGIFVGCGVDEATNPLNASATASSSASATVSSSAIAMASSGAGGATGSGGAGGATGSGGAGGATASSGAGGATGSGGAGAATCIAASEYAAYFSVADAGLCVVAMYTSDTAIGFDAPTWGRHGGPLLANAGMAAGTVDLVRLTPPAGASGALTAATVNVPAMLPAGTFLGGQAIDLPFFGWTAISYTGAPMVGKVILVKGSAVEVSYDVNGLYSGGGLGAAGASGRLLYSGLSKIADATADTNAFYAADSCGTEAASPRLVPNGDASCGAPLEISAWGDASGPVAVDSAGNAVVAMSSFDGTQEIRAFAAPTIARGAPAAAGEAMLKLGGFGSNLAVLAPTAKDSGVIAFQPEDGTTFTPLDVVEQRFTVSASTVTPVDAPDAPKALFTLKTPGTSLAMFADDQARIWVGAAAATGTAFFVVARKP